jgi:acetyl esterase/lipase
MVNVLLSPGLEPACAFTPSLQVLLVLRAIAMGGAVWSWPCNAAGRAAERPGRYRHVLSVRSLPRAVYRFFAARVERRHHKVLAGEHVITARLHCSMRLVWLLLLMFLPLRISHAQAAPGQRPNRILDVYLALPPDALGHSPADRPTIDAYLPASNPTHTAVLVIPGGGYQNVVADREGAVPARWLTERGVAAFVLHYRVEPYRYPAPIADAERAMRLLRSQAATLGFAPDHFGAWGFSAGGHIASVLATLFDQGISSSPDAVEHLSDRPDFVILAYPVISMKPEIAHAGSRQRLLGFMPDPALAALLSTEDHVTPMSPPAFLFTTNDDPVVPAQNSMLYAAASRRAGVPVELHMFEHGPHGVDLANDIPALHLWTTLLESWMRENHWMAPAPQ